MGILGRLFGGKKGPPDVVESTVVEEPVKKKKLIDEAEADRINAEILEEERQALREAERRQGLAESQVQASEAVRRSKEVSEARERQAEEGKREWASLRRPVEKLKGPWARLKESEEEKAAREAEAEAREATRTVEDIAKFRAKATRAEEKVRLVKAEGGTRYQRLLKGAAATGTAGSKFAGGAYKLATLGGPVGMKKGMGKYYSSSGMQSLTASPTPQAMGMGGPPRLGGRGNIYSMEGTKLGKLTQPSVSPRQQTSYPTRQLEQRTASPLRRIAVLGGQRMVLQGSSPGQPGLSRLGELVMLEGQRLGLGSPVQLPRAEQEVLTEINRRGNAEVPSQIVRSLTDMGISRQESEGAIRSLLQKKVIRQSGEKFGNEFVLEVSR